MKRRSFLAMVVWLAAACAGMAGGAPRRIVSVSPNITEMLYGVGAFDRVVAVSEYCTFPPAVKNLPRVGGWQDTNIEKLAALHPDMVILNDAQAPFLGDKLRELGIPSLVIQSLSLGNVFAAFQTIGQATGNEGQAAELAGRTRAALEAVRNRTRNLPRRSVLLVVDRTPGTLRDLYVATEGSYLAELIEIAGGRSVAAPAKAGYETIGKEAVLSLNPEVIIDMVHGSSGRLGERPETVWRELPELRAVREGHVYPVRDESVVHASQFVADTARLLARLIHPEAFQESQARPEGNHVPRP